MIVFFFIQQVKYSYNGKDQIKKGKNILYELSLRRNRAFQ